MRELKFQEDYRRLVRKMRGTRQRWLHSPKKSIEITELRDLRQQAEEAERNVLEMLRNVEATSVPRKEI